VVLGILAATPFVALLIVSLVTQSTAIATSAGAVQGCVGSCNARDLAASDLEFCEEQCRASEEPAVAGAIDSLSYSIGDTEYFWGRWFIRLSGSERVVWTAGFFLVGLFLARTYGNRIKLRI